MKKVNAFLFVLCYNLGMNILYQSDSVISFILDEKLYNITAADIRYYDLINNINNEKVVKQLVDLSLGDSGIELSMETLQKCYEINNINFLTLKNICLNLYEQDGKTKEQIDYIITRSFLPIDQHGLFIFCKLTDRIKSKYFVPINDADFDNLKNIVKTNLLSHFGITPTRHKKYCDVIKKDPVCINTLLLQLETNQDKLLTLMEENKVFLSNRILSPFLIDKIKDLLLFSYNKERLFNQLENSNVNWLEIRTVNNFSRLRDLGLITQKRCGSIAEYVKYIDSTYKKVEESFEIVLLDSHPVFKKIMDTEILFEFDTKRYEIVFPKNKKDVVLWGQLFGNCFGSRSANYFNGANLLFGIKEFKDENDLVGELAWLSEYIYKTKKLGDFEGILAGQNRIRPNQEFHAKVHLEILKLLDENNK